MENRVGYQLILQIEGMTFDRNPLDAKFGASDFFGDDDEILPKLNEHPEMMFIVYKDEDGRE